MTKAKTKSRRVWVVLNADGRPLLDSIYRQRRNAAGACRYRRDDAEIARATLTWTPPAKAKKRSAEQ